ncbi:hypothetical protein PBT90_01665 [Algoriphagus halophytocola]|uniref:hypothetical protein n=1 Tax=Algoriphagus halophytocola TaxID=2991499 RepID=UPI0022DD20C1|nr:hypothetical protein [Algoriphagus sp. TR-M9]WBL43412.1 hypothetical protein PBT90_01665 [Algoriphagus sp. TR-M9]
MKKLSLITLFLIAALVVQTGFAVAQEKVSFSIPKTIYFGGEKIWIAASTTGVDNGVSASQIIYAELVNRNNESVALAKMPLQMGQAFNFLQIPSSLASDHYLLRVFTRVSPYQNMDEGLHQQLVTIFNTQYPPEVVPERENLVKEGSGQIGLSTRSPSMGESLQIRTPDGWKVLEVSVSVDNSFLENESQLVSSEIYDGVEERTLVPELYGHIIQAKLNEASIDTTQLFYLSVHGEKSALFTDRPDSEGYLYFDAGGMKHWDFLVAQAAKNETMAAFEIVSPAPKTKFKAGYSIPELKISPSDSVLLKQLLLAGQGEYFYSQEFEEALIPVVTGFVEDRVYNLDDYTRFDAVETVLKEYVPEVMVRSRQQVKSFRMIDAVRESLFDENPLMLIDALPIFDADLLAAFDPKDFQKLEVLTRTFFLNEERFPGVLSFSSYQNDFGGFPLPSNAIYLGYGGISPKVATEGNLFEKQGNAFNVKDWRTVLYWSEAPGLSTSGESQISVQVPEVRLPFRVKVVAEDAAGKQKTFFQRFSAN